MGRCVPGCGRVRLPDAGRGVKLGWSFIPAEEGVSVLLWLALLGHVADLCESQFLRGHRPVWAVAVKATN